MDETLKVNGMIIVILILLSAYVLHVIQDLAAHDFLHRIYIYIYRKKKMYSKVII